MRPWLALVLASLTVLSSCSDAPGQGPDPTRVELEDRERRSGNADPWVYMRLGMLDEREGELGAARSDYGASVALLPPLTYTRPAVSLARVHRTLGNDTAARRLYEEVIRTVATDPSRYHDNPDYREAALALKDIYARAKEDDLARKLRTRFLEEFGGDKKDWP